MEVDEDQLEMRVLGSIWDILGLTEHTVPPKPLVYCGHVPTDDLRMNPNT